MKIFFKIVLLVFATLSLVAEAQEYKKLEGSYAISSESLIDPPRDEKKDRVVLIIEGRAAREIYENMPVVPKKSACDAAISVKIAKDFACTKDRKLYSCTVGLLLKSGETASAQVC